MILVHLYFGIVKVSKKIVMFCGHETKLLSSDACRDILGLISLNYMLLCGDVNALIDEGIAFVFR